MRDLDYAEKSSIVRDIEVFINSGAGKYLQELYEIELNSRIDFLINEEVNDKYTPFTREGMIGETRQYKANMTFLQDTKDSLVEEIKQQKQIEETNG